MAASSEKRTRIGEPADIVWALRLKFYLKFDLKIFLLTDCLERFALTLGAPLEIRFRIII